jgi:hypothetical protein
MANIYQERIPCNDGKDVKCNVLEVRIYYDLGGYNYGTGEPKPRGYYLSVTPLVVSEHCTSFQGFTGAYIPLNQVSRQSKKGEAEAIKLMEQNKQQLIDYVCQKHGITLKETA